jgi:predicted  nucleic acid-binding Zn-ribbon protein
MSTISALKVFALFGKKPRESVETAAPRVSSSAAMPGDAKKADQPDQQWEKLFSRLGRMEETNSTGFTKLTNSVSKLTEEFTQIKSDQTALKQDLGAVQEETVRLKDEMVAVNGRVDDTNDKIDQLKEATASKFRELEEAFMSKVQSLPVQFSALSAGQQLSVNERFESLRKQAQACRHIFVFG